MTPERTSQPSPSASAPVTNHWLMIDRAKRTACVDGRQLHLRQREFELLCHLVRHAGTYRSREQILAEVWSEDGGSTNTLHVHLSRLRAKLGESPAAPRFVHTCRRRGVMFDGQRAHTFSPVHELHVARPNLGRRASAA